MPHGALPVSPIFTIRATMSRKPKEQIIQEAEELRDAITRAIKALRTGTDSETLVRINLCIREVGGLSGLNRLIVERANELARAPLCKCGVNKALPLHPCPYDEDVNQDREPKCVCCKDCSERCAEGT
jgi:hypothetical protein